MAGTVQLGTVDTDADSNISDGQANCSISRVGGKPCWLDFKRLPPPATLACGVCTQPMALLLQIYTPEEAEDCFHRVVYVFCCKTGACHLQSADRCFAVLSCHSAADNTPYEETGELGKTAVDESLRLLCIVCGGTAPSACSKCHRVTYCSRDHQRAHWTAAHREQCGRHSTANSTVAPAAALAERVLCARYQFPQREINLDEESLSDETIAEVQELLRAHERAQHRLTTNGQDSSDDDDDAAAENEGSDSDSEAISEVDQRMDQLQLANHKQHDDEFRKRVAKKYERKRKDRVFLAYQRLMEVCPRQVLRYPLHDLDGPSAHPVWVSTHDQLNAKDVPPCPNCQGPRQFEFQITSQLLSFLDIDDTQMDSIDWGTLVIYTCMRRCTPDVTCPTGNYQREYLWRQQISPDEVLTPTSKASS